jgi:aryl-alcohol dehydrogenase-like predicted oxidoreductase
LGKSGLKVSEICIGTATFGVQSPEPVCFAILDKAAGAGVNFIDTADGYPIPFSLDVVGRSEEIIGKWLKGKRHRFVVATKVRTPMGTGPNDEGLSRKHILDQVEASLRRLQSEYIDIYYIHYPDADSPFEETLNALDKVVSDGKVRYIGCCNFLAWQVAKMLWLCDSHRWASFSCVQERYNLLFRHIEYDLVPLCLDLGMAVIAYSPLAGGFLTGKYKRGEAPTPGARFTQGGLGAHYQELYWHDAEFEEVERLKGVCQKRGRDLPTLAISWVLGQPGVASAIIGASRPEHLDRSLSAADIQPDEEEKEACDEVWYRLPRRPLLLMPSHRTGPGVY